MPSSRATADADRRGYFAGEQPGFLLRTGSTLWIVPETEVIPAIGAKECIYNLCFRISEGGRRAPVGRGR